MATVKANHLSALAVHVIRPALVEAKLITAKLARDAVYVATLAEELRTIEGKITAMEEALHLGPEGTPELPSQDRRCRIPEGDSDAVWIRTKSGELDLRLRRIEQLNKLQSDSRVPGPLSQTPPPCSLNWISTATKKNRAPMKSAL
jgi:hypothetical protein